MGLLIWVLIPVLSLGLIFGQMGGLIGKRIGWLIAVLIGLPSFAFPVFGGLANGAKRNEAIAEVWGLLRYISFRSLRDADANASVISHSTKGH